jgi:nucleoside-diphosphate-sugar epimerase
MMNNYVCLTGSRGFIGSHLKKSLVESGYHVNCLSNTSSLDKDFFKIDFSLRNQIKKFIKIYGVPKIFIHLGWSNTDDPHHENHITLNVKNSINLIEEMYLAGVQKIIFFGTSSVYGELSGLLKEDMFLSKKLNNYIEGKRKVGNFGLEIADKLNRDFINIRLFYTYGAGQKENSLINQVYRCSLGNENMNLSPCEHFRDYIHVYDVVKAIEKFFLIEGAHTVNLGSGIVIKLKTFVEKLWTCLGGDSKRLVFGAHEQPATEQSQPKAIADLTKLKKLINWTPEISIEEGIRITVDDLYKK